MDVWKCTEGQSPVKRAMSFQQFLEVAYSETNAKPGHPSLVPTKRRRDPMSARTSFYLQWRGLPTPTQQRDLEAELALNERQCAASGVNNISAVTPKVNTAQRAEVCPLGLKARAGDIPVVGIRYREASRGLLKFLQV